MKAVVKHVLTGKDGETHDIGRWSWAITTLSVLAGGIWNAVHTGVADLMVFSQAIGVLAVAHGGALFAKAKTEPEVKE